MTRPQAVARACGTICCGTACFLINGFLLLTLCLLSTLLYTEWRGTPLRLPEPLIQWAITRTLPDDYRVSWDSMASEANGHVRLNGFSVNYRPTDDQIVSARQVDIRIDLFGLITSLGTALDSIQVVGGEIRIPGMWSDSGVNEVVVTDLAGTLNMRFQTLNIRDARGRFGPVFLRLTGSIDRRWLPEAEPRNDALTRNKLHSYATRLLQLKRDISEWKPVWLEARIAPTDDQTHSIGLRVLAEELAWAPVDRVESVALKADLALTAQGMRGNALRVQIEHLEAGGGIMNAFELSTSSFVFNNNPISARLSAKELAWGGHALETLTVDLDVHPEGQLKVRQAVASYAGMDPEISGLINIHSPEKTKLAVRTQLNPARLLAHLAPDANWRKEFPIDLNPRSQVWTRLEFGERWVDAKATFSGSLLDPHAVGETFQEATFEGTATPQRIVFHSVRVTDHHEQHAEGSFLLDIEQHVYRLVASGHIYPGRLDNYIRTGWWEKLREQIQAGSSPFYGDIDLVSIWSDYDRTRTIVRIEAEDLTYNGQPAESAKAFLRQGPHWGDLLDLQAEGEAGTFDGRLRWRIREDENDNEILTFFYNFHSTLPLPALAMSFEQPWIDGNFSSQAPPDVHIDGVHVLENDTDEILQQTMTLQVESGPFAYKETIADSLSLMAEINDDELILYVNELGLFGGSVQGRVRVPERQEDEPPFSVELVGRGLDYPRVVQMLRTFSADNDAEGPTDPLPGFGLADVELNGHGVYPLLDRFVGEGSVALSEADLGTVRLVGVVSRVLEQVGLPFTSFSLRSLKATGSVQGGTIIFPDLVLSGPTMRIQADGEVDIQSQTLEVDLRVYLLTSEDNPLVTAFGLLFRPLTHALELELSGSLEDPQWRFKRNPFNLFRPQESTNETSTP